MDESKRIAVSVVSGFSFTGNPGQSITGDNTNGRALWAPQSESNRLLRNPRSSGNLHNQTENIHVEFHRRFKRRAPRSAGARCNWRRILAQTTNRAFDDPAQFLDPVTVSAGQQITNLNFILNHTAPRFDNFEDGEVRLEFPKIPFLLREPSSPLLPGVPA